ncbi:MAG: hypothetical protein RBR53_10745 [Desulforegulaceae bacterium]|nr:hypothetical protein [Desulforegulaceae bacterium]
MKETKKEMKTSIKSFMFNMTIALFLISTIGCMSFSEESNSSSFASGNKLVIPVGESEILEAEMELSECERQILNIKDRMASGEIVEGEVFNSLYTLHSLTSRKDCLEKKLAKVESGE